MQVGQVGLGWLWFFGDKSPPTGLRDSVGPDLSGKAVAWAMQAGQVGLGWLWFFRGQVPSYRVVCCPVGGDLSGKAVAWAMEVGQVG